MTLDIAHGRLLGRVLAHEVGHALLLTLNHSTHGLMSPQLEQRTVAPLGAAQFALSASDRERLATRFSNTEAQLACRRVGTAPAPSPGGGQGGRHHDPDRLGGRPACSFSAARAALRMPRSPSLPSWQADSKIGCSSSRVSRMPNVHGFTHVVASSNVIDHSRVSLGRRPEALNRLELARGAAERRLLEVAAALRPRACRLPSGRASRPCATACAPAASCGRRAG